ncbi:MAG: hypothetical protein ABUT11_00145, partial [Leifsonia sp.]
VFGHPVKDVTVPVDSILMPPTVQAESCPGGPVVASVERGARVVAIARNADGTQVQVRNPRDVLQLVWVPTSQVDADTGEAAVSSLPLGAECPTVSVAQAPVVVTPVTPTKPVKPTHPGTPDTTKPTVGKPTFNSPVQNCYVKVSTTASDNVGVTSVSISWTSAGGNNNHGSGQMTATGGHWEFVLQGNTLANQVTTFVVTAHDAAGNSSAANSAAYSIQCLI